MSEQPTPIVFESHELQERLRGLRGRFDELRGRL